jgi:tetratricopeptide (TPR) repeat protein
MAAAILLISGSVGTLFTVGQQYLAFAGFAKAEATVVDVDTLDQAAAVAYGRYPDDAFLAVRTRIAFVEMSQLLSELTATEEPSEPQQQAFLAVSGRALALSDQAITLAPHDPEHYAVLAAIYNNLAIVGVSDALDRTTAALTTAKNLDPLNPTYQLIEAQMAVRRGDVDTARTAAGAALTLKPNFTEALFLLTDIETATGNTEAAIAATQAIIQLEPNNPARYYQLGLLWDAADDAASAQQVFDQALAIDPNHANARYSRAILLIEADDIIPALRELRIVQVDNQGNELLSRLIQQLEFGVLPELATIDGVTVPVREPTPSAVNETLTVPTNPDSSLLTPLNAAPARSDDGISQSIDVGVEALPVSGELIPERRSPSIAPALE